MALRSTCIAELVLACAALAGDLLTPGEQVLAELDAALAAADAERAVPLLREVGGLYRYPASADEAAALLKLAGRATRADDVAIARAAVEALGETHSKDAAPFLDPFLRGGDPALMVSAVQAAGRLRLTSHIPALLKLAHKGSDLTVADQALGALGEYCAAHKGVRKGVTDKLLSTSRSLRGNRKRWRRLRAPAIRSLQRLTGQRMNSVQMFTDWWKVAKTRKDPFTSSEG